ncbi:MAG: hypothetical protein ACK5LP_07205 [Campylobacteraceae bacterium]
MGEEIKLLEAAVNFEGSLAKVGKKIGYSKSTLSLILMDKYPANNHTYKKLKETYGFLKHKKVLCPALKDEIHIDACKKYAFAVFHGKELGGTAFAFVKDICRYCENSRKVE